LIETKESRTDTTIKQLINYFQGLDKYMSLMGIV